MANYSDYKVYSQSPYIRIVIKRIAFPEGWLTNLTDSTGITTENKFNVITVFTDEINDSGKSKVTSYNFSKSVKGFGQSFQINLKEDYIDDSGVYLDNIQIMDIVYIFEDGFSSEASFIGIVESVSFGATAGAGNKVITIGGSSIGKLWQMLNFATDVTAMSYFQTEAGNVKLTKIFNDMREQGNMSTGIDVKKAFSVIYNELWLLSKNKNYCKISTAGLFAYTITFWGNLNDCIKCDLTYPYQVSNNFFNISQANIISYFRNLMPEEAYEIYEDVIDGKPKIVIREKPFDNDVWNKLPINEIDPSLLTDYTFTKSNNQIFSSFFSQLSGSPLSKSQYVTIAKAEQGQNAFNYNLEKVQLYGYKPLIVNFVGYSRKDNNDETLKDLFIDLSKRLKNWYSRLDEMWNGDITLVNYQPAQAGSFVNKKRLPKIGERVKFCGGEFYVTQENHNYQYGNAPMINYQLERGGDYSKGDFNPLTGISQKFAELLKRD